MAAKNNKEHKQDLAIVRLEKRADAFKDDIKEIKDQLTNHIPSQIGKIYDKIEKVLETTNNKIDKTFKDTNDKIDGINNKILIGFTIMIASTLILQVILKFYN